MRPLDQNYSSSDPPLRIEWADSGAVFSPSLHTFTRECGELDPINARVFNINSCDDPRNHLTLMDTSNTKHAGSNNFHEVRLTEKLFEWMKVKRNQAGTGKFL